jgi:hypothetical protein
MRATILTGLLALLLAACGGGGASSGPSASWPADFERWICDALEELESNAVPATDDLADAMERLDVDAVAAAAETAGDSGAAARGMLDLAPVWERGTAAVEDLYRATALFAEGGSHVASGATTDDLTRLSEGRALLEDATAAMAEADVALTDLRAETGFACREAVRAPRLIGPGFRSRGDNDDGRVKRPMILSGVESGLGCRCSSR